MVSLLSAGSPGAAGDGQSREAGVPGGERGSPALLGGVVLQYYSPLPPVKLRGGMLREHWGGSTTVVNAAATVQQHFLRTSLWGSGEGEEEGDLAQQRHSVQRRHL